MSRQRLTESEVDDLLAQVEALIVAIERDELTSGASVLAMLRGARVALMAVSGQIDGPTADSGR